MDNRVRQIALLKIANSIEGLTMLSNILADNGVTSEMIPSLIEQLEANANGRPITQDDITRLLSDRMKNTMNETAATAVSKQPHGKMMQFLSKHKRKGILTGVGLLAGAGTYGFISRKKSLKDKIVEKTRKIFK